MNNIKYEYKRNIFKTLNHEIPDKIPLDVWFSGPVWEKLKEVKNIKNDEELK